MHRIAFALSTGVLLAACNRPNSEPTKPATNPPAAVTAAKTITLEDWKKALQDTYEVKAEKPANTETGMSEFMAKFKLTQKEVNGLTFGNRDAFRKLYFFRMGLPMQISTGAKFYISLPEGKEPAFFVQPYYWGHGWIFLKKMSVLVDGDLVFEHECGKVDRDTKGVGVEESCDFIPSDKEIDGLRKVKQGAAVAVRMTGEKGYVNLKKDSFELKHFVLDIESAIAVYDLLNKALKPNLPSL